MASNLDDEIEDLQARITSLKRQVRIHASTLITAPSTRQLLTPPPPPPNNPTALTLPSLPGQTQGQTQTQTRHRTLLADAAHEHQAHAQQCLYRACATVTTFRARDPDPRAVDGGAVLGLRVDVLSRARFLRPYYVLLNRPFSGGSGGGSRHLRVHRHTLPACVPLAGLAGRYLPAPSPGPGPEGVVVGKGKGGRQDLARFARALRREVVRYHHRLGVVADLRKAAAGIGRRGGEGGGEDGGGDDEGPSNRLVDIAPADAQAKQLTIEWADGRTGRLVIGDDGEIVRLVVLGENGRDHEAGRDLLGGAVQVEDVVERLAALA